MLNNDILRNVCAIFNLRLEDLVKVFSLADKNISKEQAYSWLKQEDDSGFVPCTDEDMIFCLDGLIYYKRGKQEGATPKKEQELTNNLVLKKIKIALALKNEDLLDILNSANITMKEYEVNALFRKEDHKNYRKCKDKLLRSFLKGLQKK